MSDQDFADRPATFREVLASGEYRALYFASALSWFGDYVARAAVTSLVYQQTGSVAASAATFAISYVPWLGFGPVLAALAERLPFRRTLITADLIRMVLIALVALPGMPVWSMIALLFATSLCNPPFDAARSALLAKVLTGDRYVVGMTLQTTSHQAAQVAGYLSGAGLSAIDPQAALLFNSVTFGVSAVLIALQVKPRPPSLAPENRTHLLRETASGLNLVFRAPLLRGVAILVFLTALFAVVPEGLAAGWAATLSTDPETRGWTQGAIMIANPVGFILGGLVVGRMLGPKRRQRIIRVFALALPATLTPALLNPPVAGVVVLSFVCGIATAGLIPVTNGLFVQALPNAYRARAFGVMKSGVQVLQGLGVLVTGFLADQFSLPVVVGLWGVLGIGLMAIAILTWPSPDKIAAEIARVQKLNKEAEEEAESAVGRPAGSRRPSPGSGPRPRPWPGGELDPVRGYGPEPGADPWGYPSPYGTGAVIGRARVVPRNDTTAQIALHKARHAADPADPAEHDEPPAPTSEPAGGPTAADGRHSSDAIRRRISRPIGRIYSTESARSPEAHPPAATLPPTAAQPQAPTRQPATAQPPVQTQLAQTQLAQTQLAQTQPPAQLQPPTQTQPPAQLQPPTQTQPPAQTQPPGQTQPPAQTQPPGQTQSQPAQSQPAQTRPAPTRPAPIRPPASRGNHVAAGRADPTATDPQWYPLADPPGSPGDEWPTPEAAGWSAESRAAYQHAVQQHAAHQHAVQQRQSDRPGDREPPRNGPHPDGDRDDDPPVPQRSRPHPYPAGPM